MSKGRGKKKNQETVLETIQIFTQYLVNGLISVYLFLLLVIMPFYFTKGFSHIGTDKADFFRVVTLRMGMLFLPILLIYVILSLFLRNQKRKLSQPIEKIQLFRKPSITDLFMLGYLGSLLLSYVFSNYKNQALWGATGCYMGLFTQVVLVVLYFIISRFWVVNKKLIFLILPVSAVVFFLGYLNRFSIYPISMENANDAFLSTIGNINWYCGYIVTVFFGGVVLLWRKGFQKRWQELLLVLYVGIGFATLATQGSASGLGTMVVIFLVLLCMSSRDGQKMESLWKLLFLFSIICLLTFILQQLFPNSIGTEDFLTALLIKSPLSIVMTLVSGAGCLLLYYGNKNQKFSLKISVITVRAIMAVLCIAIGIYGVLLVVNTCFPNVVTVVSGNEAFRFSGYWGSRRGGTWMAGWKSFQEQNILHMLFGVGPDCMSAYIYENGSEGLRQLVVEVFETATLTNAHNEWLTILVNCGLLGMITYVGMMITAIYRYLREGSKEVIMCGFGISLLAYTVNNLFSFQQTMNYTTMMIILGLAEAYHHSHIVKDK